jgi:hypothetical protein
MAGGLAGYPHTGRLAVAAWASHATTETSGALLLINMPHIGITQQADLVPNNNVGRMHRKGKVDATNDSTCGAAFFAYSWSSAAGAPPDINDFPDNYQYYTLANVTYPFSDSFSGSYSENMIVSTELIRSSSDALLVGPDGILNTGSGIPSNLDVFYCNGVFINTDYGYNSYVSINSFQKYSGSGGWEDFTSAFTSSLLA